MALTESRDIALGAPCPDFRLPSVDGKVHARDDFRDKPVMVVMFICNHFPYVQAVEDRILALNREYAPRGEQLVSICASEPTEYPEDRPEKHLRRRREKGCGFPYLSDD